MRATSRHSAEPERYGELSERQYAREIGDELRRQRRFIDRVSQTVQEAAEAAALIVGPTGSAERALLRSHEEKLERMEAGVAKLVKASRCDTVTGVVTKRCDRLMGHKGEHLYSDTKNEDWVPRIPLEESR